MDLSHLLLLVDHLVLLLLLLTCLLCILGVLAAGCIQDRLDTGWGCRRRERGVRVWGGECGRRMIVGILNCPRWQWLVKEVNTTNHCVLLLKS